MLVDIHTHHQNNDGFFILNCFYGDAKPSGVEYASLGFHPMQFAQGQKLVLEDLDNAIKDFDVIGECGLDRRIGFSILEQVPVFIQQLAIAERHQLPVILHVVRAFDELLAIRKDFPNQIWLVHGFCKSERLGEQLKRAGMKFSFGIEALNRPPLMEWVAQNLLPGEDYFFETDQCTVSIEEVYQKASIALKMGYQELEQKMELGFGNFIGKQK